MDMTLAPGRWSVNKSSRRSSRSSTASSLRPTPQRTTIFDLPTEILLLIYEYLKGSYYRPRDIDGHSVTSTPSACALASTNTRIRAVLTPWLFKHHRLSPYDWRDARTELILFASCDSAMQCTRSLELKVVDRTHVKNFRHSSPVGFTRYLTRQHDRERYQLLLGFARMATSVLLRMQALERLALHLSCQQRTALIDHLDAVQASLANIRTLELDQNHAGFLAYCPNVESLTLDYWPWRTGKFGTDPSQKNHLAKFTSVAGLLPKLRHLELTENITGIYGPQLKAVAEQLPNLQSFALPHFRYRGDLGDILPELAKLTNLNKLLLRYPSWLDETPKISFGSHKDHLRAQALWEHARVVKRLGDTVYAAMPHLEELRVRQPNLGAERIGALEDLGVGPLFRPFQVLMSIAEPSACFRWTLTWHRESSGEVHPAWVEGEGK